MFTECDLINNIPVLLDKPFLEKGDRLCCYGDSITEAEGPTGYVTKLRDALAPKGIEVINAGVGGDKTTTAFPRLFPDVISRQPTAVSLFFGTNDAVHGHGRWSHEPSVAWQTLRDNLKWMVHICRLNGIHKFSINVLPGEPEGWVLAEYGSRANHIRATRLAAEEGKTICVPLDYIFDSGRKLHAADFDANGWYYTKDGLHMNEFGAELMTKTMLHCWKLD